VLLVSPFGNHPNPLEIVLLQEKEGKKNKLFIFLAFFELVDSIFLLEKSVSGFPLTSREHAVEGLRNVLPSVWE